MKGWLSMVSKRTRGEMLGRCRRGVNGLRMREKGHGRMRVKKAGGITVVEMIIVIAVIALIASFIVPALFRARMTSNEARTVANLRALASAQIKFQSISVVDQDEDLTGEYGLLEELAGAEVPRQPVSGGVGSAKRMPGEFMPQLFGQVDGSGYANVSGYLYVIYLPNQAEGSSWVPGDPLISDPVASAGVPSLDAIGDQEVFWVAYAWPELRGKTGIRAFGVSVDGIIYFTDNNDTAATVYDDTTAAPVAGAVFLKGAGVIEFPHADEGEVGIDDNVWKPLRN